MGGVGGPRARAIETAGRWFGPLAQRKPRPAKDKAFAEIRRAWHFIDAKGEILGRLAAKIAPLLCGKHKPIFQTARDVGDYVVVTNVEHTELTSKNKLYYRHSGFPGGLKAMTYDQLFSKNPVEPLRRAINGMLPKNKLRYQRMCRSTPNKVPVLTAAHQAIPRPALPAQGPPLGRRARGRGLTAAVLWPLPKVVDGTRGDQCVFEPAPLRLQAATAALPGRGAPARGAAQRRQPGFRHAHATLAHGPLLTHSGQDQAPGDALRACVCELYDL